MTSRPAPSKRPPVDPSTKPPCKVHSLALVADKAQITGTHPVEIGENTVLHPYASIKATGGSVRIGKNCIISENAVVGVGDGEQGDVIIGDEVNIESGAVVEATSVGDSTVIEVKAKVGKGAKVGKYCKIAPLEQVRADEEFANYTVVYGDNQRRLDQTLSTSAEMRDAKHKGQLMQIELLKKLIPDTSSKWR